MTAVFVRAVFVDDKERPLKDFGDALMAALDAAGFSTPSLTVEAVESQEQYEEILHEMEVDFEDDDAGDLPS